MFNLEIKFDGGAFERDIKRQLEQKVHQALMHYPNVKAKINWSTSKIELDGPDDEVSAARKALERKFQ